MQHPLLDADHRSVSSEDGAPPMARDKRPPSVSSEIVYAIGDIHGRMDLLDQLLQAIIEDFQLSSARPPMPTLVTLGDYVDRGPDSKGVMECLVELKALDYFHFLPLMGNHEEAMLAFLKDSRFGPLWLRYGGGATLKSYGAAPPDPELPAAEASAAWAATHRAFREAVPANHIAFLEGLPSKVIIRDYVFVHAGIRPGAPLLLQRGADLRWIREPFLSYEGSFRRMVVHGHTAISKPYVGTNRINCDTHAYASGVLTALRLQQTARSFIQVSGLRYDYQEEAEPQMASTGRLRLR